MYEPIEEEIAESVANGNEENYEISDSFIYSVPVTDAPAIEPEIVEKYVYLEREDEDCEADTLVSGEESEEQNADCSDYYDDEHHDTTVSYNVVYINRPVITDAQYGHICELLESAETVSVNCVSSEQFENTTAGLIGLQIVLIGIVLGYFVKETIFRGL